jgi:hypothetical protein
MARACASSAVIASHIRFAQCKLREAIPQWSEIAKPATSTGSVRGLRIVEGVALLLAMTLEEHLIGVFSSVEVIARG